METYSLPSVNKPLEFNTYQNELAPLCILKATDWGIPLTVFTALGGIDEKKVEFDRLMGLSTTKNTKGPGATKNRNEYIAVYRPLLVNLVTKYLLNNSTITEADKLVLRIKSKPAPGVVTNNPTSWPISQIKQLETLAHHFVTTDSETGKKARPAKVLFSELRYCVGLVPPTSIKDCPDSIFVSDSESVVRFAESDRNKNAYYYGRWVNSKGQVGPWTAYFFAVIA